MFIDSKQKNVYFLLLLTLCLDHPVPIGPQHSLFSRKFHSKFVHYLHYSPLYARHIAQNFHFYLQFDLPFHLHFRFHNLFTIALTLMLTLHFPVILHTLVAIVLGFYHFIQITLYMFTIILDSLSIFILLHLYIIGTIHPRVHVASCITFTFTSTFCQAQPTIGLLSWHLILPQTYQAQPIIGLLSQSRHTISILICPVTPSTQRCFFVYFGICFSKKSCSKGGFLFFRKILFQKISSYKWHFTFFGK